jgi:predicted nucleic acid-binding protein
LANALADDTADGDLARARLNTARELHAPHLIDLEFLSVLRGAVVRGVMDEGRVSQARADLADLRLVRYPHEPFADRIWELRHNLTPYDAAYIAVAEALGCPLVTADERLRTAPGPTCEVDVITGSQGAVDPGRTEA